MLFFVNIYNESKTLTYLVKLFESKETLQNDLFLYILVYKILSFKENNDT